MFNLLDSPNANNNKKNIVQAQLQGNQNFGENKNFENIYLELKDIDISNSFFSHPWLCCTVLHCADKFKYQEGIFYCKKLSPFLPPSPE